MKRKILFLIIIFYSKILGAVELENRLDNSTLLTGYKKQSINYSYMLINSFDSKSLEYKLDLSFETAFLKAGRIQKRGIWRELFNPLNSKSNSDTFQEAIGFKKDFAFKKDGLYGISLISEEKNSISMLLPDKLWLGGNYSFAADPLIFIFLASVSGKTVNSTKEWTSNYPLIPGTIPMHIGLDTVYNSKIFKLDYLAVISGSTIYKAGSFNRLFVELSTDLLNLKALYGTVSPYFISAEGKSPLIHYLLSFWAELSINKYWKTMLKSDYSKDHRPVLASAFIPTEGSSFFRLSYDNSKIIFYTDIGQNFNYDFYGTEFIENSVDLKAGYSGAFSFSGNFGLIFDFDNLRKRKYELILGLSSEKSDLGLTLKHTENIYKTNSNLLRIKINTELGKGVFYSSLELGNEWKVENFKLGIKTKF